MFHGRLGHVIEVVDKVVGYISLAVFSNDLIEIRVQERTSFARSVNPGQVELIYNVPVFINPQMLGLLSFPPMCVLTKGASLIADGSDLNFGPAGFGSKLRIFSDHRPGEKISRRLPLLRRREPATLCR